MTDIDSGKTLIYRIITIQTTPLGATFGLSVGYYDPVTPTVWLEQSQKWIQAPATDVVPIMTSLPEAGLTRREDMLKVWTQYFLDKGLIAGTLVPSL
jgi:hypothetical protein